VKHIDPAALAELRTALDRDGSGLSLHAIDVIDYAEHLREQLDRTLAKDFLALYTSARALTSAWHPDVERAALWDYVEHLGLLVRRLAPLYDDVRIQLRMQLELDATRRRPLPLILQGAVPAGPFSAALRDADPALLALPSLLPDGVLHLPTDKLAEVIQNQVDSYAGRGLINPDELASVEVEVEPLGPDEVAVKVTSPELLRRLAQDGQNERADAAADELAFVKFTLGPTLRTRIGALLATGRFGQTLPASLQTLLVLGMLDAEATDPRMHVQDPQAHVSSEGIFIRFALPHEDRARRAEVVRLLMHELAEWCGDEDPLHAAFAAAVERLPR